MNAGALRHRITIDELVITQDSDTGAVEETWAEFCSVWAAIIPLSGREFVAASAIQDSVNTRITIRWREGILPEMRVHHAGAIYNIKAVLPDPTFRRHINLMCETGANDG